MVAKAQNSYQLLIADDDDGFRETLCGIFEPFFTLCVAETGEEAVEIATSTTIHLALLDMHMPVFTGLETVQILCADEVIIPCIIISADADEELRKEALEAHAFSVLKKPVRKRELIDTVSIVMEETYDDTELLRVS